ncbi:MAG TPA: hypothetical protein VNO52_12795 [Methylomirabilota bacterium]|nr:hypothetical protein [Methylomirabilota bacterium]
MRTSRVFAFRVAALVAASVLGLVLAEVGLRTWREWIRKSDQMDPGLIRYDSELGWALTPGWRGQHRHFDFEVAYEIGLDGFRREPEPPAGQSRGRVAVVGDSFTFGLGVSDADTFVSLLNRTSTNGLHFKNYGVPGYSTDQEVLLIEREVLPMSPTAVVLVVYLANDVVDNLLPVPVQGNLAKPFFETVNGQLVLHNSPVPKGGPASIRGQDGLASLVMGKPPSGHSVLGALAGRFELGQLWLRHTRAADVSDSAFAPRLERAVDRFDAIIGRLEAGCRKRGARLVLALLGGRSLFDDPKSLSASYQDYLRREIKRRIGSRIHLVDVLDWTHSKGEVSAGRWFFAHDGHLTRAGHGVLSRCLAEAIIGVSD